MAAFSKRGIVLGLILLFGLGILSSAWASCVYNKTGKTIKAYLDCPGACSNVWYINSNDDKCRPGKGGEITITIVHSNGIGLAANPCDVKVDAHGWVTVNQSGDKFTIKSKHKDGSIRGSCTTASWE